MADFTEKLKADIVEQFKGQPNITALAEVVAKQLQDVFTFYEQLQLNRDVKTAVGKQLDGVGNIVELSRVDAGLLTNNISKTEVLDDDTYRKYLIWKILKNTSHTTYPDIIKAFRMFWSRPLYYSEDPEQPATMIFDTGEMEIKKGEEVIDTTPLFETPLIRAAGVTLKLYATTKTTMDKSILGIAPGLGFALTSTELPYLERKINFDTTIHVGGAAMGSVAIDDLPELDRKIDFSAKEHVGGAAEHSIMITPIGGVERR